MSADELPNAVMRPAPVSSPSRAASRALAAAALALLAFAASSARAESPARRPNVVLVLADDLGWRDSGVYGSRYHSTPNLDQLAREGVRFTNAYAANPLCSPTRAALLTGLDPARLRFTSPLGHLEEVVLDPIVPERGPADRSVVEAQSRTRLPLDYHTLAEALRDAGYATAHFGKWHLGNGPYLPEHQGFAHVSPGGNRPFLSNYFSPYHLEGFEDGPSGEHIDDRLASEALTFLSEHRDEPVFLNLWFFSVHIPLQTRIELKRKYALRRNLADPQQNPEMAGMIETMDTALGTLLRGIEKLGLQEKTIVIFLSDNGGMTGKVSASGPLPTSNAPLRGGKGSLFEGGLRVPLIVRWPGRVAQGVVRDQLVTSTDIYPTILELAGVARPPGQTLDGISIVPALQGKPFPRNTVFTHFPHYMPNGPIPNDQNPPGTSVRKGSWKLIRFYDGGTSTGQAHRLELYDLETDPGEGRNVAATHPQRVSELNGLIDQYLLSTSALVPVPNPAYRSPSPGRRTPRRLKSGR